MIFSSHNIKALQLFNLPFFYRGAKSVLLKNMFSFSEKKYISQKYHGGTLTAFYADSRYVIQQTEKHGFVFKEMVGVNPAFSTFKTRWFSPWIYYVFAKE